MNEPLRLTAAQFRQRQNFPPPGQSAGTVKVGKPAIRMPKPVKMTKCEAEYQRILEIEFPKSQGFEVKYEAITLRLSGGNYVPDFTVWNGVGLYLVVEAKGSFRLGSAGRSHMAFKTSVASWPHIKFRFAQKSKEGWKTVEAN